MKQGDSPLARVLVVFGVSDLTGASRMGFYFAQAFQRAGVPVSAASPPKPPGDFAGAAAYASVVDALGAQGVSTEIVARIDRLVSLGALRRLTQHIRRCGVTHIVSIHQNSLKYAAAGARLAGVRHVSSRQGPVTMYGRGPVRWLKAQIFRQCLRHGTALAVCTNTHDERQLVAEFGVPQDRVRVLANGIDLAAFPCPVPGERGRLRGEFGVCAGELMLVNVGRLDPQKDQLTLLRAFQSAQPLAARLILVGNVTAIGTEQAQRYADSLHAFVRENGLAEKVIFAGWRNDVPALLHASDIYVHSAAWEGFPLAMCEAMAARLPFLGTDCFGTPEGFTQGEHGWLVPTGDTGALAATLRQVAALAPEQRARVGESGRRLIEERYDVRRLADRFVELTLSV